MMNQRVRDILRKKGEHIHTVTPLSTVIDAVNVMNDHHIGSVLVMDTDEPVGIFSERDVLVRVVAAHRDPRQTLVRDVMTTRLFTTSPDEPVLSVMQLMTERRFRHLPVVDDGVLVGLISIGDITKATQRNLQQEVRELSSYISGPYLG